jgi:transcriptional regulator with XRE-family HTH domain
MVIGQRLRELRKSKNLSQGDIEKRTGLLSCYTSRVECGRTIPSVETLEKYARAMEIPMYQLFYEGDEAPQKPDVPSDKLAAWNGAVPEPAELSDFLGLLKRLNEHDRITLLTMAQRLARRKRVA